MSRQNLELDLLFLRYDRLNDWRVELATQLFVIEILPCLLWSDRSRLP